MSNTVTQPHPIFADIDGSPLNEGFIFIGESEKDPISFPVNVYWDSDLTELAEQPLRTKNGYIVNGDNQARIFTNVNNCSVSIRNKNNTIVLSEQTFQQLAMAQKVQELIQNESDRATAAEANLNTSISNETSRATIAENALSTAITSETNRAVSAEAAIQTQVNTLGAGNRAYLTYAAMDADKASIPAKSKVTVTNDATSSNNGDWQWDGSTFTKSVYDPLQQAKNYADANPMFKSVAVVAGNNVNNFVVDGRYKLSSNLATGNLMNWPQDNAGFHQSGTIFVLGINSAGVDYPTQIYLPYVNIFKMKVRRKISSTTWEPWGTLSTLEDLLTIFVSKTELTASNTALLSEIAQYSYFGKPFTPAEILGTAIYSTNTYYVGLNATHTSAVNFNKIKARIWNPTVGNVEYRIFTGAAVSSGANGYFVTSANTGNYTYTGTCKVFPSSDLGDESIIELDQIISIGANSPFVIAFKHASLATFRIGYHTVLSGNLVSRGFNLGATNTAGWALNITATNPAAFLETGFQLLLDVMTTSDNSGSDYVPTLVIPPKIYALEGLESHVYPEHTLVEDYKLYEHDVTCTKGIHKKRGWVWTPTSQDTAGTYPITLAVHNKQTGVLQDVKSSSVILAAKNAYSGITKNVCVIGDSLVQPGVITQRLLDVDVTDVMNISLVGTRGTAPNKHEGRGGWTIADYTGAGRTYYRFSVSGVVVEPAVNATIYAYGGSKFLVQEIALSGGSGTITCSLSSGSAPTNGSSGTMAKDNTAVGDASIAFSNVQSQPGNPFWDGTTVNFANYLSVNSLSTPDYVFIQLGINDTFNLTSDVAVEAFTSTAFPALDTLINSIKASSASTKIAVVAPPSYADQDAFGYNYACNQTSWRTKRNIITYNKKLYEYYAGKEAQNIYVVGSGVNLDTENNFPIFTDGVPVNSHNPKLEYPQINAVHPADSGYKQIGDVFFAFIKAV